MSNVLSIVFEDNKRKKGTLTVRLAPLLTAAQIDTKAQALATALAALVNGAIRSMSVNRKIALPGGLPTVPAATSDIEVQARLLGRSADNRGVRYSIPTYDEGSTKVDSDELDLAHADLAPLIAALTDGAVVDNGGSAVEIIIEGYEAYGNANRD